MRKALAFLIGLLFASIGIAPEGFAQQTDRVALVVGNAAYPDAESPLRRTCQ